MGYFSQLNPLAHPCLGGNGGHKDFDGASRKVVEFSWGIPSPGTSHCMSDQLSKIVRYLLCTKLR